MEVIEAFLEASRNTFPDEFLGLLAGNHKKRIVEELVVVPAVYGEAFSSIRWHLVPFDKTIMGTCHSHPSRSNSPSKEDKNTFSKTGAIHLIACVPYSLQNVKGYDENGKIVPIRTI